MKRIFSSLFGGEGSAQAPDETGYTPVGITAYSQPHVLQKRMKEEKMTHGQTVTANLSPVRLELHHGQMVMYFCPMETIEILEILETGDGGVLPLEAKVDDLSVPAGFEPGFYRLKNVTLTSNGAMQVKATSNTIWESVEMAR